MMEYDEIKYGLVEPNMQLSNEWKATSRLTIGDNVFVIEGRAKIPNRFVRFWQKLLLDFRWEKLE